MVKYVRPDVSTKWYDVGKQLLDIEDIPKLDTIKVNSSGDSRWCTFKMLQLWLDSKPHASWKQLIEVLRTPAIGLEALASKIEDMLSKGMSICNRSNITKKSCNHNNNQLRDILRSL